MVAKNAPLLVAEATQPAEPSSAFRSSSLVETSSVGVVPMVTSSPEKRSSSVPGIISGADLGTAPGTVPGYFPGNVQHMKTVSAATGATNVVAGGELPKPPPPARVAVAAPPLAPRQGKNSEGGVGGGGDGDTARVRPGSEVAGFSVAVAAAAKEEPVLRTEDGGLVRGVVSHVTALMQVCVGEKIARVSVDGVGGKHARQSRKSREGGVEGVTGCATGKGGHGGNTVRGMLKAEERVAMHV